MKRTNIVVAAALLSVILTGCGVATEEIADSTANSIGTQAGTEKTTETAMATETEKSAETTQTTEAESEKTTEAASEKTTENQTEKNTEAETAKVTEETTKTTDGTSAAAEPNEVFALNGPLGRYQSPEEFGNASFAASFTEEDLVKQDDGTFALTVMIYRYELFSGDDITALKKGDVIWCLGHDVVVDTIETRTDGTVVINGGIENGGRYLKTDDGAVYFESGMNDVKSYYEIGENTYTLAENFVLTDSSDLDNPITYTAEEFSALDHGAAGFINSNTIVETENDVITAIERVYIP